MMRWCLVFLLFIISNSMNAASSSSQSRPNIILILNDDMGFSDIGCYGGEIDTPNLDSLARGGLRYTQFYNTARCCPSRASLLTGLYPQQADVGHMIVDDGIDGYLGDLSRNAVTIAEVLKSAGYGTYMSGKWHITHHIEDGKDHNWPANRGFDDYYGTLAGAANYYNPKALRRNNEVIEAEGEDYYFTDVISREAVRQIKTHTEKKSGTPFFQYVAYTAPHWPLHAHPKDIAKYKGRFDKGWDKLREERYERLIKLGIIKPDWKLSERTERAQPWADAEHKEWEVRRMEVYAAMIDRMDQGIGWIIQSLKETGQFDNTLILFLSDNGGCAEVLNPKNPPERVTKGLSGREKTRDGRPVRAGDNPELMPGPEDTYQTYGASWANLSNTPFRYYKQLVHEGGIATPLIAHWPAGIKSQNELRHQPAQLPDIMATCLEIASAEYPKEYRSHKIKPLEGVSMVPTFTDKAHSREALYWEHSGNSAVRKGRWKLVKKVDTGWQLYDLDADRSETNDLIAAHPEVAAEMKSLYEAWAARCNVMPWEKIIELRKARGEK
jgi:arylsulfatase A-like enzyme